MLVVSESIIFICAESVKNNQSQAHCGMTWNSRGKLGRIPGYR